jgi:hypothetical protein
MKILTSLFGKKNQLEFFEDKNGIHHFGGKVPKGFKFPENKFLAGFQYLGKISNMDPKFNWLPFDLNLICPILTDFEALYLDYSDNNNPKIIHPENSESISSAYSELTIDSEIIYEEKKFSIRDFIGINDDNEYEIFAITGKPQPNFESEPVFIPKCPKTNKKMRFVTQIFSNNHLKSEHKNFESEDDYEEKIHQHMNFWCDGSIIIFLEPTSKVVYYSIANT